MKKRLTVHLENVPKTTKEYIDQNGEKKTKKILTNTLAFTITSESQIVEELKRLKKDGKLVTKHYVSNIY